MSYLSTDGDFEQIFMTSTEFVDQFVGTNLYTWGYNLSGQLGDGTTTDKLSPATVAGGGTTWKQVFASEQYLAPYTGYSLGIKTDGTLWTWGANLYGQLGDGTTTSRSSPATVAGGGTTWNQVASGFQYSAAIKTDGTLWTWGYNGAGTLGDGTTTSRSSPATVAGGGTNWKSLSVCGSSAGNSTAAIKTDGTLWTWGNNSSGDLGDGTTSARSSPVTALGALTTTLYDTSSYQVPMTINTGGGTPAFIANTPFSGVGGSMRSNGGYLYTAPSSNYILNGDFTLEYWFYSTDTGGTYNNQFNIGTMSGGSGNGIGVRLNSSDSVYLNGAFNGYLNDLLTYAPVSTWNHLAISRTGTIIKIFVNGTQRSSFTFTSTLNSTGAGIYLFTSPDDGRNFPGYLSNFRLIKGTGLYSSSFTPSTTPLTAVPNTVFLFTGTPSYYIAGWKQVSVGGGSMGAVKTDGTLWTWGYNPGGQLGTNNLTDRSSPGTTVNGGTNWKQVSMGWNSSAAIKTDGTLWTCGSNNYGQGGDGTTTGKYSFASTVGGGTNWKKVVCGGNQLITTSWTAAIKTDGTLWTWGHNGYGQLGLGDTTSRLSPTQVISSIANNWKDVSSGKHTMALAQT